MSKINIQKKKVKEKKSINAFILLFSVLAVMAVLSYIIPAGQYARELVDGRSIIVPNSYETIARTPVGFLDIFSAIHEGMVEAAPIVFYVIIIGGMISVMNSTGSLDALLASTSKKLAKKRLLFISVLVLLFSLGGTLIGMGEESLIYIPIVVPFALAMGYDLLTGTAIVMLGMCAGFTTAVMNPFTVGVAQGIAELPMFSGMTLRIVLYIALYIAVVAFVYNHGEKVRKNPSLGVWDENNIYTKQLNNESVKLETKHKLILLSFVIGMIILVFGVIKYNWGMSEYSGIFILISIAMALIWKMSPDDYIKYFLKGAENILPGALIIGVARGIVVVLTNGNIIDTILYYSASLLQHLPSSLSVVGMFIVQGAIHLLVPSGSGQAMLTMPIMIPLSDLLNVTRQTTCLIFTLADGIGNTWIPTSGILMAVLAMNKIPYRKWIKTLLPLLIGQYVVSLIVSVIANMMNYGPF
ncbi:YfcC family protein [uncultured Clostridium sp.]|uniref:YfcC family protein n=1 Tax=uncultured Clostridium sp. TaxID=59620 RepID=UPI002589CCCB|nr:C4-dicarboxylate ABC transporter permease [uncultured Clostridium sp.]